MLSLSIEAMSELIVALNDGPLELPPWGSFLDLLRQLSGANGVVLMLRRPEQGDAGICFVNGMDVTPQDQQRYADEFAALDPFVNLPDSVAVTLDDLVPKATLQASEYYQRFMVPAGHLHFLGMDVYQNGQVDVSLRLMGTGSSPTFGVKEKRLLHLLLPHLRQLMRWWHQDLRLESERNVYENTLTRLAMATVFLDRGLRIVHSNPVAQRLLQSADGLMVVKGQIKAVGVEDNQKLQATLKHASTVLSDAIGLPQALTVRRRSAEFPLYLVVRPMNAGRLDSPIEAPRVAVFISAPELRMVAPEAIQQLLGFTPKEAQLVIALVNGMSLEMVARDTGVARNTVRAHLYSMFRKVGVTQQSALVGVVIRSVLGLE